MGVFHSVIETRLGARVRHRATFGLFLLAGLLALILLIEFDAAVLPQCEQFGNRLLPCSGSSGGCHWVVRYHQAAFLPLGFGTPFLRVVLRRMELLQVIGKVTI